MIINGQTYDGRNKIFVIPDRITVVFVGEHVYDITTNEGVAAAKAEMRRLDIESVDMQRGPWRDLEHARSCEFKGMEKVEIKFYREIIERQSLNISKSRDEK